MAISSTGGADTVDSGGPMTASPGGVTAPGTVATQSVAVDAPADGGRPVWLPEGFDTEADFQAAYNAPRGPNGELVKPAAGGQETTAGAETTGADTLKGGAGDDTVAGGLSDDAIRANLKAAGGIYADPRYEAGALEFEKTGDVSDATKAALATAFGVDVSAITAFVDGEKAKRTLTTTNAQATTDKWTGALHGVVGGAETYGQFIGWAKENLSADEQTAYNEALDKNPATAKILLAGFNERFKAAGNGAPRDITQEGQPAGAQGVDAYASSDEMQRDMNDPRYGSDPAFRRKVEQKVGRSTF